MPGDRDERAEMVGGLIDAAMHASDTTFVTHAEFKATIEKIETKIEVASLKQRQWVLGGCLAIILTFGGGYVSLMSKIDRLTEALPQIAQVQHDRAPWIARQEQRDGLQDQALKKLDPTYQPLPYQEPPQ